MGHQYTLSADGKVGCFFKQICGSFNDFRTMFLTAGEFSHVAGVTPALIPKIVLSLTWKKKSKLSWGRNKVYKVD